MLQLCHKLVTWPITTKEYVGTYAYLNYTVPHISVLVMHLFNKFLLIIDQSSFEHFITPRAYDQCRLLILLVMLIGLIHG